MKYCPQCGQPNPDDAAFCGSCGNRLAPAQARQSAYQQPAPPPTAYAPASPAQPQYAYQQNAYATPAQPKDGSMMWLILNIASVLLFCPGSFLFSAIGIVLSAMARGDAKKGDWAAYKKKNTMSMVLFLVGILFGILGIIGFFFLGRSAAWNLDWFSMQ